MSKDKPQFIIAKEIGFWIITTIIGGLISFMIWSSAAILNVQAQQKQDSEKIKDQDITNKRIERGVIRIHERLGIYNEQDWR